MRWSQLHPFHDMLRCLKLNSLLRFLIKNIHVLFQFRYEEIKRYSYLTASSSNGKAIGHFSQLVWKGTTHFGVGIATMPSRRFAEYGNKETFIVAMYTPPGNLPGGYSTNVQPRKDGCQGVSCKFSFERIIFH